MVSRAGGALNVPDQPAVIGVPRDGYEGQRSPLLPGRRSLWRLSRPAAGYIGYVRRHATEIYQNCGNVQLTALCSRSDGS